MRKKTERKCTYEKIVFLSFISGIGLHAGGPALAVNADDVYGNSYYFNGNDLSDSDIDFVGKVVSVAE